MGLKAAHSPEAPAAWPRLLMALALPSGSPGCVGSSRGYPFCQTTGTSHASRRPGMRGKFPGVSVLPDHGLELQFLWTAGWACRVRRVVLRDSGHYARAVDPVGPAVVAS